MKNLEFVAYAAAERTSSKVGTLTDILNQVVGSSYRMVSTGKSLVVNRPDGTSALIHISKSLQAEIAAGLNIAMLGGCEVVTGTFTDADGAQYEAIRLQRPEGYNAGPVITSDTVQAYVPVKVKAVAPTGLSAEALLAQLLSKGVAA